MSDTLVSAAVPSPSTASTTALIHARGLTKRFGEFTAVDAIDFDVAPGESFGFLGPQRRRQDLDDADDRLRLAADRGHAARSWAWTRDATGRRSGPASASCPSRTPSTPS